jgi:hypothetical protein
MRRIRSPNSIRRVLIPTFMNKSKNRGGIIFQFEDSPSPPYRPRAFARGRALGAGGAGAVSPLFWFF